MSKISYIPMRILTDTPAQPTTGIPIGALTEIGRLGMGVKVKHQRGFEYPQKCEHFVPRGESAEGFTQLFGDTPSRVPICFFSDEDENSCSVRLEIRDKAGDLVGFSDGENYYFKHRADAPDYQPGFTKIISRVERPNIAEITVDKLRAGLSQEKAKHIKWKSEMYLKFMIRGFPRIGYWRLSSGGENSSIPQVVAMVDHWKALLGSLAMVPFELVLKTATVGDKSFNYINLLPAFSIEDALCMSRHRAEKGLPAGGLLQHPLQAAEPEVAEPIALQLAGERQMETVEVVITD